MGYVRKMCVVNEKVQQVRLSVFGIKPEQHVQ